MYHIVSVLGLSGQLALALAGGASGVSPEAHTVHEQVEKVADCAEQSVALFGPKSWAFSSLASLSSDDTGLSGAQSSAMASLEAKRFLRALPEGLPVPEIATDPDGSVSLDWVHSRTRMFSVSIGENERLAFAWVDGGDSGYGVASFDGSSIPRKILEGIEGTVRTSAFRAA